jgi:FkbM family methyltransferase
MIASVKTLVNQLLKPRGYVLTRVENTEPKSPETALKKVLARVSKLVPGVATVIDIGASNGSWTAMTRKFYPNAAYYLIDANPHHEPELQAFAAKHPNVRYVLAAAGDSVGQIYFDMTDPLGGLASHEPFENARPVPMTTVDTEVEKHGLKGPFFLKLDTHGFEVPILKGAEKLLAQTDLVEIEVYNFHQVPGTLLFYELCTFMAERGFRPIDICDPLWRERDGVWWQMDIFFARADHAIFSSNSYK